MRHPHGLRAAAGLEDDIALGLRFYYSTTLYTSLQDVQSLGTFLSSGATIPSGQYVYMTWLDVSTGSSYQFQNNLGVSVSSVSTPYLIIGGVKYPTSGSYNSSELPLMYFSDSLSIYVYQLNPVGGRWGGFSSDAGANTPEQGWGAGGSITYIEGGLG
jgi:hypothetical protein